ncbi:Metallo-dependent phosphatase-like protein [Russula dissimulans]|nr:Metallo-dependent phosphatase-like protein [Russula dissimulans]
MADCFTFKTECNYKYSERVYEAFLESFCALPLAAVMNKKLCIYGEISPELPVRTVDNIRNSIDSGSHRRPASCAIFCGPAPPRTLAGTAVRRTFAHNHVRGYSYCYTYKAACNFLEHNRVLSVIRAHEVQDAGVLYVSQETRFRVSECHNTFLRAPSYLDR